MNVNPRAESPANVSKLLNVPKLATACYREAPSPSLPKQRVAFGTSEQLGSVFEKPGNERHLLAIIQAICLWRTDAQAIINDRLAAVPDRGARS
jgi:phosphoglucomutase